MRRNCNLELRLLTPCVYSPSSIAEEKQQQQQQKTSSVFYNGRMDVFDATELQARAILWLASGSGGEGKSGGRSPVYSPTWAASLKSFLEKRKSRAQATSPYHHHQ
ncbi:protein TIFY 5B-like isoform X1 [Andrographis paniculata]|uniref:protein TIFY 5B-like isoform X1 n=1 Tax=Andrographis paniculata TaxID=175694 RepID=UPI0021E7BE1F|nr:protein TIFY 5B-like isoform X1 [Andrographis paniculata]